MMVEQRLADKLLERARVGREKYGVAIEDNPLTLHQWYRHLQEELLDAAVYIERIFWEMEFPRETK